MDISLLYHLRRQGGGDVVLVVDYLHCGQGGIIPVNSPGSDESGGVDCDGAGAIYLVCSMSLNITFPAVPGAARWNEY